MYKNLSDKLGIELAGRSILQVALDARMYSNGSAEDFNNRLPVEIGLIKHYLNNWTPTFHDRHKTFDSCVKQLLESVLVEIQLREE